MDENITVFLYTGNVLLQMCCNFSNNTMIFLVTVLLKSVPVFLSRVHEPLLLLLLLSLLSLL